MQPIFSPKMGILIMDSVRGIMNARRLRISVVVAVIVVAGFAQLVSQRVASSSTANASISWLAAGDSFASGAGLQHTTKGCAQGTGVDGMSSAWAEVAASQLKLDSPTFVACTGAISRSILQLRRKRL